jgi:uncharacterized protein YbjT (DUF2867 family)
MSAQKIAVAGATGRIGRQVADVLDEQGHDVVRMSRAAGVDVISGEGLEAALAGVDVIVHTATQNTPDQEAATQFFTTATRNLQEGGARAGAQRLAVISIVNADRHPTGFGAATYVNEQVALAGPLPVRILRATQFHEFVEELMNWGRQDDVSYVWNMRTQLVAARTAAERLAELAVAGEAPQLAQIAGPRVEHLVEMARLLAARRGEPARVEEAPIDPDDPVADFMASGGLLPDPDVPLAGPTYAEWLESQVPAPAA